MTNIYTIFNFNEDQFYLVIVYLFLTEIISAPWISVQTWQNLRISEFGFLFYLSLGKNKTKQNKQTV